MQCFSAAISAAMCGIATLFSGPGVSLAKARNSSLLSFLALSEISSVMQVNNDDDDDDQCFVLEYSEIGEGYSYNSYLLHHTSRLLICSSSGL